MQRTNVRLLALSVVFMGTLAGGLAFGGANGGGGGAGGGGAGGGGSTGGGSGGGGGGKGGGMGQNKPPVSGSHHAHQMPQGISNFNSSAAFLAGNLMSLSAREAFQASVNSLAATYSGLKQDAHSGQYDTSKMGDMLQGFGNNVNEVQLPNTQPVTDATLGTDGSSSSPTSASDAGAAAGSQNAVTVVVMQPHETATPSVADDPSIARPDEQIISNLSQALQRDQSRPDPLSSRVPDPVPGKGTDRSGGLADFLVAPTSSPVPVFLAGAGDPRAVDVALNAPAPSVGNTVHAQAGQKSPQTVASASALEGNSSATATARSATAEEESATGPRSVAGDLMAKPGQRKVKAAMKPSLPPNLLAAVSRVQGEGAEEPAPKTGNWTRVRDLTRALLGPRLSTFFQPLELSANRKPASLAQDDPGLWWRTLVLPFLFTFLFAGITWITHSRQNRRLMRQRAQMTASEIEGGRNVTTMTKRRV